MIRTLFYQPDQEPCEDVTTSEFTTLLKNAESLLWVDFDGEPDASAEAILTGIFRFHPLAVDDALEETHTPKVDDWGEYLYIVLNAMSLETDTEIKINSHELDVFLGKNFVVTHHDTPIASIEKARALFRRDKRYISHGPDHLLYKIIDDMVADYMPMVELLDDKIDEIEDCVLNNPRQETLQEIFALKRALQVMRRIITPQREVLNKLARDEYEVVDPKDRIFFRDVYDHLVRLHELNESMRDLVGGALDTYLSVVNNRMNDVMKTLTIITTLFMPISFVTGFFGMNFFEPVAGLTSWTDRSVFVLTLTGMISVPVGMFRWMKKQTWV